MILQFRNKEKEFSQEIEKGITIIHKIKSFNKNFVGMEVLDLHLFYKNNLEKYDEDIFENNSEFIKKELIKEINSFIKNKNNFMIIISNLDEYLEILNDSLFDSLIECFSNYYLIIDVKNIYKLNKKFIRSADNLIVGKLPVNTKRYIKNIIKNS